MKNSNINAQKLRWILVGMILFGISVGVVGIWYLDGLLTSKVAATNDAILSAQISNTNLDRAQALKIYLENHKDEVDKAALIVAQTTAYQYQNQIVEDITKYAQAAGVTIIGFDFPQDISGATTDKTTGLKSLTATITLLNPTPYKNYLSFLKYIEQNLTKMQITDISISPDVNDQNQISSTLIGIQVYVK